MGTKSITLRRLMAGEDSPERVYCKVRNTDTSGVSKTEPRRETYLFRWEKIPDSNQYLIRWKLGGAGFSGTKHSIKVTDDEDLDFVEDSDNPLISYKLFARK